MNSQTPGAGALSRLAFPGIITGLLGLAWLNRFIQDDAFISFRYAENLARGQGLVWAPDVRIEGYTNFLWTVLMALPQLWGWDPIIFSQILGLSCFLGTLLVTYQFALETLKSKSLARATILLLGTNYTFSSYATGGLETQLQACFVVLIFWLTSHSGVSSNRSLAALSLFYALALMTRLDSAIFVVVSGITVVVQICLRAQPVSRKILSLLALALPSVILVGSWFLWKLLYYGDVLPNTYYAKAGLGWSSSLQGLKYIQLFLVSYGFVCLLVIPIVFRGRVIEVFRRRLILPLVASALWFLYIVRVGGDFMEFRFFVPVLPLLFLLITWLIFVVVPFRGVSWALTLLLFFGSFWHAQRFTYEPSHGVESISNLADHIQSPFQDWDGIGRSLRSFFPAGSDVVLATTAAGAIPYYSKLPTVDMLGLNDPWIARNGLFLGYRPGHQKTAPLDYLLRQDVNLVLGHPWLVRESRPATGNLHRAADLSLFRIYDQPRQQVPERPQIVDFPVSHGFWLRTLYLTPHPDVDRAIEQHSLRTFSIDLKSAAVALAR